RQGAIRALRRDLETNLPFRAGRPYGNGGRRDDHAESRPKSDAARVRHREPVRHVHTARCKDKTRTEILYSRSDLLFELQLSAAWRVGGASEERRLRDGSHSAEHLERNSTRAAGDRAVAWRLLEYLEWRRQRTARSSPQPPPIAPAPRSQ